MNKLSSECDKIFKKAESSLKTSFFSLKFSPDYVSATTYFQEAGKGYLELKNYDKSIVAFLRAAECDKKVHDTWAEATNYEEIAKIYLLEKDDFTNGLKYLKQCSYCYQVAGKAICAPRLYLDLSCKLKEKEKIKNSILLLQEAFNEGYDTSHDDLARIMLEEIHVKLLDLFCMNEQYVLACDITEKMIKMQTDMKIERKNKITKNYSRIVMLRIIMNEEYLCEGIIEKMYSVYDSSCGDDIEDIKILFQYYNACNKQKFNSTITYSFELYENNLLKRLKSAFDKRFISFSQSNMQNANNIDVVEKIDVNVNDFQEKPENSDFADNWK